MSGFKKILQFLIPAILIGVITYNYFRLKSFDFKKTDPSIAISENNLFFLETSNLKSFIRKSTENNIIWEDLHSIAEIAFADSLLTQLKELRFSDPGITGLFNNRALLAINTGPEDMPALVIILQKQRKISDNKFISELNQTGKVQNISRENYKGNSIYNVEFNEDSGIKAVFFTSLKGLFIASFSSSQIMDAIITVNSDNQTDPVYGYQRLKQITTENETSNLFLNLSSLDKFLNFYLLNQLSDLQMFSSSAGFDMNIGKDNLVLNGFMATDKDNEDGLQIISGQKPSAMRLHNFIPASASLFFQLHFNDITSFFNQQNQYPLWKPNLRKLKPINETFSFDLRSFFESNSANEFGLVLLNHKNKAARFFITEVKSGSNAGSELKDRIKKWASANNTKPEEYHFYRKIDAQEGIHIYRLPLGGIPEMVFGKMFSGVDGDYFTVFDNYLIFGNSVEELGEYTYQLVLGRTFSETDRYKKIQDNLLSFSNIFIFLDPIRLCDISTDKMAPELLNFYQGNKRNLEKISTLSLQINPAGDLYYSRIFFEYSGTFNEYVNTVWMSKLDSTNVIKPAIVLNHHTGEREIMVQDALNQLYLISSAGRILWKVPLDGPIMSEIHQIDYYRNRRLQYLFNTKSQIYLIDRNGNAVGSFPVALRSPATNGLALFDYESDGNLRICIASESRLIYMYDREGKIVSGWNPSPTDHTVKKTLQHFRVNRKDYIVASDPYKTYIYDRQGGIRVKPEKQYPVSKNNPFFLDLTKGINNARLISTDTLGNILYFYLSGNSSITKTGGFNNDHYFVLADLNGSKTYEYIFVSENVLQVKGAKTEPIFETELNHKIEHPPFIYEFSGNDRKIGITLEKDENIYLFNNDGTIYKGFPLKGSTLFSISSFPGFKARFNLIVGNKDNFLYNYAVQ